MKPKEKIKYKGLYYEPLLAIDLDLKQGDKYLFNNGRTGEDKWTLGEIDTYHQGGIGIELLEGRMKYKFWYIFPDRLLCKF